MGPLKTRGFEGAYRFHAPPTEKRTHTQMGLSVDPLPSGPLDEPTVFRSNHIVQRLTQC